MSIGSARPSTWAPVRGKKPVEPRRAAAPAVRRAAWMKDMDPKRILEKLPRFDRDQPFRYLGRRVVQAMAEGATTNLVIGARSAPGRYLVLRLAGGGADKESWEQQWSESRATILSELER